MTAPQTTPARFNSEFKAKALDAANRGLSLEGIAHLCGVSRVALWEWRRLDPEFNSNLLAALAAYELRLINATNDAIDMNAPSLATAAHSVLRHRFPQRHGIDPRMRLDARAAQEGYAEDLADPERNVAADTTGAVIARLVDRMLEEDEKQ